jgi:hypothetical protein
MNTNLNKIGIFFSYYYSIIYLVIHIFIFITNIYIYSIIIMIAAKTY